MAKRKRSKPKEKLDIVIPVHRNIELLSKCVEHIQASDVDFEYNIIIVDNATPKEESVDLFSEIEKKRNVFIIHKKENVGFPRACNTGARRRMSPFIFFLNDDVLLDPYALQILMNEFEDDENLGIAGMRLLFPEEDIDYIQQEQGHRPKGKVQHVGLSVNVKMHVHHPLLGWRADHPKVMAVRKVWGVTGAAMMIRRSVWKEAQGFDEEYNVGTYEDCDLCMKVNYLGYNIIVNPEAWGVHYTGATAEKYDISFPLNTNRLTFFQRWGSQLQWSDYLYL